VFLGKLGRSGHVHELEEDGGVDGSYSVGSRICSGEGTEKVSNGLGSLLSWPPNCHGGLGRVHQCGIFLDDGRELFRNGISLDGCLAPFVVSSLAESDDVDLEDLDGVRVPAKVCRETEFIAEMCPATPCRANVPLGGRNIRLKFPRLCNAEVTEVIILGRLWQRVQGVSWGYTESK